MSTLLRDSVLGDPVLDGRADIRAWACDLSPPFWSRSPELGEASAGEWLGVPERTIFGHS